MNKVLETIHSLRTIHGNFSKKDVNDEDLKTIVNSCVRAANASARQSYSIVVVNDRKIVKQEFAYEGSKALLFCIDYTRIIDAAKHLGKEFRDTGIHPFITGGTDTILAAQTAAIAAKSLGIDSLFTNSIYRRNINSLYDAFKLPKNHCFPLIALILGYAEEEPAHLRGRLNGKGVIHFDEYHRLNDSELDELVSLYDDSDKHIAMHDEWKKQGYEHYLDWFYTSWTGGIDLDKDKEIYSILHQTNFIDMQAIRDNG